MKYKKMLFILIFLTSMLYLITTCSPPAYAADNVLTVNAAWADGDLLKVQVTAKNGAESTLALRLSDYVNDTASEYISIQAADLDGNKSSVIQVKNPYYVPADESADKSNEIPNITLEILPVENPEFDGKPLTPDGSGTVMDNVFDDNGKEIFSLVTEDGNVFYLIVDRERTSDNVYFLNAVTEEDLIALAQKKGITVPTETTIIPTTESVSITENITTATSTPEPESKGNTGSLNSRTVIFIIVAVLGVGGAGYYFKIYKKKNKTAKPNDEDIDDYADKTDDLDDGEYGDGDDVE